MNSVPSVSFFINQSMNLSFCVPFTFQFENKCSHRNMVVKLLQDIFEIVTNDMMVHGSR